ncbi:lasso peptide biosynthesis B2 protein [Sphingopyxis sp. LC81]|uniref:lasso peptide biosynthesis B2 protein n=1 Tax=Sphingopyxis sp. LC81 TaxID=1502850 RepID=UPI00056C9675|nr:lasso peptide biosynthesis B2 protein [Sphingopyxis sp. LC81]
MSIMSPSLRPGLHDCRIGGDHIFFDLPADRYFLLPPHFHLAFESYLSGAPSDHALSQLLTAGLIGPVPAEDLSAPPTFTLPTASVVDFPPGTASAAHILRVIWMQRRVRAELRRVGILDIVAQLERGRPRNTRCYDRVSQNVAAAFLLSRRLVPAADQCLVRGIAMKRLLAQGGCDARLVFGVTMPFSAHCWVQADDVVLSDTLDIIRRYQPIFAV